MRSKLLSIFELYKFATFLNLKLNYNSKDSINNTAANSFRRALGKPEENAS